MSSSVKSWLLESETNMKTGLLLPIAHIIYCNTLCIYCIHIHIGDYHELYSHSSKHILKDWCSLINRVLTMMYQQYLPRCTMISHELLVLPQQEINKFNRMVQPIHPSTAKDEVEERLKQELQNTSFKEWKAAGFEPEKRQ